MKKIILPYDHPLNQPGHKKPVTRREFLGHGLVGASGFMFAPSVLQLLSSSNAFAADPTGCTGASNQMPAFVTIFLSGGAALASHYVALNSNREMIKDYGVLGLGGGGMAVSREFGNVAFAKSADGSPSGIIQGIRAITSQAGNDKTSFIGVMVPTADDDGGRESNLLDASALVTAAGLNGTILPHLGSTGSNSNTGIHQASAILRPGPPLIVNNVNDVVNAIGLNQGVLNQELSNSQKTSLLSLIDKLTGSQAAKLAAANSSSGKTLASLVSCATGKNLSLVKTANPGVDPVKDAAFGAQITSTWQLGNTGRVGGITQSERAAFATMVYNSLNGNAGTVGLELGGFDNTHYLPDREMVVQQDRDAGSVIGMALETAHIMGRPIFVNLVTDGGASAGGSSDPLTATFTGDRGDGGMSFIFAYNPGGRPVMKNDTFGYQIGSFNNGQVAIPNSIVGTPEKAAVATFANYLQFATQIKATDSSLRMKSFEDLLPRRYTTDQFDEVLRFA